MLLIMLILSMYHFLHSVQWNRLRVCVPFLLSSLYRKSPSLGKTKWLYTVIQLAHKKKFWIQKASSLPSHFRVPGGTVLPRRRPCRRWCGWAWSGWTCRTGWAAPWPWTPGPGWSLAGAAGHARWPHSGSGGHPCCQQPETQKKEHSLQWQLGKKAQTPLHNESSLYCI